MDPFRFLRVSSVPWIARHNYAHELRHISLWGVFAGLLDGSFSSIVVAKTFAASPLLISVVWATPNLAFLLAAFWGIWLRGRRRIRMFTILATAAAIVAASIAFTPATWRPWGGWIFALQIAAARIFLAGIVNLRSSIWSANYPSGHRAHIASGLQTINGVLFVLAGLGASSLFDFNPQLYRIVYPAAAIIGILALLPLQRIRVRRERHELRHIRAKMSALHGADERGRPRRSILGGLRESFEILRTDRAFARYCAAQNFLGSANFLIDPVLTIIFTRRFGLAYLECSILLDLLPTTVMILTTRYWGSLFDRVGVLRFRIFNSAMWLCAVTIVATGVILTSFGSLPAAYIGIAFIPLGRLFNGLARGGGAIAWNLGHLHFAKTHNADLYMGIHVGLTGLRGITMPFLGTFLYQLVGAWSFVLAAGSAVAALDTFRRLARDEQARNSAVIHADPHPEALP